MRALISILSVAAFATSLFAQGENPGFGAVEGRVVDLGGKPVAGASVYLLPTDRPVSGRLDKILSDEYGFFRIENVPPGSYTAHAYKLSDSYPDTLFTFYAGNPHQIAPVTVAKGKVAGGVLLVLGPKAARLSGTVVDTSTGLPVTDAQFVLSRADNPEAVMGTAPVDATGHYELLVPPVGVRITVTTRRHKEWHFGGDGWRESRGVLTLQEGKTGSLDIRLERNPVDKK